MKDWQEVAANQAEVISTSQLRACGVSEAFVRAQIDARRWKKRSPRVVTTTTGPLSEEQRRWLAVLHPQGSAILGGLTAAEAHGLKRWERPDVTVLVDDADTYDPLTGVRFFRTRRSLFVLRDPKAHVPLARIEPAILLFAAHERNHRTALGSVTACVQQGLTTPERLRPWIRTLRPLRRAADLRVLLGDLEGGSQSLAEIDVLRACRTMGLAPPRRQKRRTGRDGRVRYTDLEWDLPDGRVLVLEVDGAFHADFEQYTADVRRSRSLTTPGRIVVRCTTLELRHEAHQVAADLRALGVPLAA